MQRSVIAYSVSKPRALHAGRMDLVMFCVLVFASVWDQIAYPRHGAHGVVVSHPLRMRKALGSIPSVSTFRKPKHDEKHVQTYTMMRILGTHVAKSTQATEAETPPAGLEPAIFGLEVRRLVH